MLQPERVTGEKVKDREGGGTGRREKMRGTLG